MIGNTFNWFEKRQKYSGGEYLPELALYSPSLGIESDQDARTGASRILLEDKYLFDMIGDDEIDKKYPLIIIATARPLSAAEVRAITFRNIRLKRVTACRSSCSESLGI